MSQGAVKQRERVKIGILCAMLSDILINVRQHDLGLSRRLRLGTVHATRTKLLQAAREGGGG